MAYQIVREKPEREAQIVSVQDLSFSYPAYEEGKSDVGVLHDISLEIPAGQFVAVLGHNGSGKSTLAKHFNCILLPESGRVYVVGLDTAKEENTIPIRRQVGMVFQNPDNQIVASIVEEDVAFALENLGIPHPELQQRVDQALKAVNMYAYRNHSPHQLSGGQKQRIAIAGVIAMQPKCIILDEPTAMLDPSGRAEVVRTIRKLNKEQGICAVLITHYMNEAAQADRVVVMNHGRIVADDTPKAVFSQVEFLEKLGLDVPQSTRIMFEMKQAGYDVPDDVINVRECADAIEALVRKAGAKR